MTRAEQAARMKLAKAEQRSSGERAKSIRSMAAPIVVSQPAPASEPIIETVIESISPSVLYLEPRAFDPSEHPVADVLSYMDSHEDEVARIIQAESDGKGRRTIIARGE